MNEADVIVAGAGPCGLAAALRLHGQGIRAVVYSRQKPPALSPRLETVHSLDVIGHAFPDLPLDGRAGIHRHPGGVSWWTEVAEDTAPGYVIDRAVFDAALLTLAKESGIEIRPQPYGGFGAPLTLFATGRHGGVSRRRLVRWRQIALTATLTPVKEVPAVWTETLPEGWVWAVRHQGTLTATVFTDPANVGGSPAAAFRRMVAASRLGRLTSATGTHDVSCCEVTPSTGHAEAVPSSPLLAGDAALARDPLSAQGLNAALSDGIAAAAAVATALEGESEALLARTFMRERQCRGAERHLEELAGAYFSAGRRDPYWSTRSANFESKEPPPEAWHPATRVKRSPRWSFSSGPVLRGDRVVLCEQLVPNDTMSEPVAWLSGKPVRSFLPPTSQPQTAGSLAAQWVRAGLVTAEQAPLAMRWLTRCGILVPADAEPEDTYSLMNPHDGNKLRQDETVAASARDCFTSSL